MKSSLALTLIILAAPISASAHIHMIKPTPRVDSIGGDANAQKSKYCGSPGYSRAAHPERVTQFKPGATIRVMWEETISHPGWYRISFQPNGEAFTVPPPVGNGGFPTADETGVTDPATGSTILLDRITDGVPGAMQMADITLPNIECDNCTLQFTQFMTDKAPYTNDALSDDIYFNCADLTLSNTAPDPAPDAGPVDAGPDAGNPAQDDGTLRGGCSAGGSTALGGFAAFALLGLVGFLRRRATR
ncbi:MAG: SCE4755 family polysaccharide monooxygenase-like protein [Kofleriaceae bacterium]